MSKGKLREQLKGYQRMKPLIAIKEYIMIILCTIPYAIAVNWILVPHTIVGGGLTGLCEILYFATNTVIPIWLSRLRMKTVWSRSTMYRPLPLMSATLWRQVEVRRTALQERFT